MSDRRTYGHGRAYGPEESERVRDAVRNLLKTTFAEGGQVALARALGGIDQSTISKFLSGVTGAGITMAGAVAKLLGITIEELTSGRAIAPRFRTLPGWAEAEAEARRKFRQIPGCAWRAAGGHIAPDPLVVINANVVFAYASAWLQSATEEQIEAAEAEEIDAIMADEDRVSGQKKHPAAPRTKRVRKPDPDSAVLQIPKPGGSRGG